MSVALAFRKAHGHFVSTVVQRGIEDSVPTLPAHHLTARTVNLPAINADRNDSRGIVVHYKPIPRTLVYLDVSGQDGTERIVVKASSTWRPAAGGSTPNGRFNEIDRENG
jgi:hypothetical protein